MVRILAAVAARMSFGLSPMPRAASGSIAEPAEGLVVHVGGGLRGKEARAAEDRREAVLGVEPCQRGADRGFAVGAHDRERDAAGGGEVEELGGAGSQVARSAPACS